MEKLIFTKDGVTTEVDPNDAFRIGKLTLAGWVQI